MKTIPPFTRCILVHWPARPVRQVRESEVRKQARSASEGNGRWASGCLSLAGAPGFSIRAVRSQRKKKRPARFSPWQAVMVKVLQAARDLSGPRSPRPERPDVERTGRPRDRPPVPAASGPHRHQRPEPCQEPQRRSRKPGPERHRSGRHSSGQPSHSRCRNRCCSTCCTRRAGRAGSHDGSGHGSHCGNRRCSRPSLRS